MLLVCVCDVNEWGCEPAEDRFVARGERVIRRHEGRLGCREDTFRRVGSPDVRSVCAPLLAEVEGVSIGGTLNGRLCQGVRARLVRGLARETRVKDLLAAVSNGQGQRLREGWARVFAVAAPK